MNLCVYLMHYTGLSVTRKRQPSACNCPNTALIHPSFHPLRARLIRDENDIDKTWLSSVKTILLTASASTPEDVVQVSRVA